MVKRFLFYAWCMEDAISKRCSGSDQRPAPWWPAQKSVSRATLAATILTPGFSDQAGDIGLRVSKPERLLTPILAEFLQLPVCQVSPKGIGGDFVRGFPVLDAQRSFREAGGV
jgi:hypothetical protein